MPIQLETLIDFQRVHINSYFFSSGQVMDICARVCILVGILLLSWLSASFLNDDNMHSTSLLMQVDCIYRFTHSM